MVRILGSGSCGAGGVGGGVGAGGSTLDGAGGGVLSTRAIIGVLSLALGCGD
tara:strand:- start:727 stop:882 length:156 start_codon:yes stop_codon:yes gene_type:complete